MNKEKEVVTLQQLVTYVVDRLTDEGFPVYAKGEKVFFQKEDNIFEVDVEKVMFWNRTSSDLMEYKMDIDLILDNNFLNLPDIGRILSYFITDQEYEEMGRMPKREIDKNGQGYIFIDPIIGIDGQFVNRNELDQYQNLLGVAYKNLESQFDYGRYEFKQINQSNLYKLDNTELLQKARRVILLDSLQKMIIDKFGTKFYSVISDKENLYVTNSIKNVDAEVVELFNFTPAWQEKEFKVFSKTKDGSFKIEKVIKRN